MMAITYNASLRLLIIRTPNTAYAVEVGADGVLTHLHWGGAIGSDDDFPRGEMHYRRIGGSKHHSLRKIREEFPAWGGCYFNEPTLKATFADGTRDTELRYIGHTISNDGYTLQIELRDPAYPLTVTLHYETFAEFDLINRWCTVRNDSAETVTLESVQSAAWYVPDLQNYRLTHLASCWGREYEISRLPLTQTRIELDSRSGIPNFIHEVALAENAMSIPKTLDEFLDLMRAWKAKYPESTPISGGYTAGGPMKLILSALGVVTRSNAGSDASIENAPSIYKNNAIIPAANKEVYSQYLTTLKTLYDEQLISPDFFTLDANMRNAMVANGESIVLTGFPYTSGVGEKFDDWEAMVPLTSAMNSTPQWDAFNPVAVGQTWLGADCAYPEVVLRWLDWYYTDEGCVYMWLGPMEGQEQTMDIVPGWYFDEKNAIVTKAISGGKYANLAEYYLGDISPGIYVGNYSSIYRARLVMAGKEWISDIASMTASTGDNNAQISMYNKMKPYVVNGFPAITYVDSDTATKISDLQTLLGTYIQNQSARFITGDRSLSELDAFFTEIKAMGMDEYQKIYSDIYATYLSALK